MFRVFAAYVAAVAVAGDGVEESVVPFEVTHGGHEGAGTDDVFGVDRLA